MEKLSVQTPFYVFDMTLLRKRMQWIRSCLNPQIQLCYSVKANPWIVPYIKDDVDYFEVCSMGELLKCQEQGVPEQKIVFGGVAKTEEEIKYVSKLSLKYVSIESISQLEYLQSWKQKNGGIQDVLLRLSSGNQFGLEEKQIENLSKQKANWPNLNFMGLHYYSGTQKKKSSVIISELYKLEQLTTKLGYKKLEYGPGVMVSYFTSEDSLEERMIFEELSKVIGQMWRKFDIGIELGRFMVAPIGQFWTRIVDIKENNGKKYYILDGGRNHFVYPNSGFGIKTPSFYIWHGVEKKKIQEIVTVCGPLCTSSDILVKNLEVDACEVGDLFVFEKLGAYSSTESMALFLRHEYPALYISENGNFIKIQDKKYLL